MGARPQHNFRCVLNPHPLPTHKVSFRWASLSRLLTTTTLPKNNKTFVRAGANPYPTFLRWPPPLPPPENYRKSCYGGVTPSPLRLFTMINPPEIYCWGRGVNSTRLWQLNHWNCNVYTPPILEKLVNKLKHRLCFGCWLLPETKI